MISWLQRNAQRHYKWLFLLLLAVTTVAFVLTITPAGGGLTGRAENIRKDEFFGRDLASEGDVRAIMLGAQLSMWLNSGSQVRRQQMTEQFALERTALLAYADQLGVPAPNDEELETYIKSKRAFAGADGQFDNTVYEDFQQNLMKDRTYNEEMVHNVLVEDYRADRVKAALLGPGYVLPYEAQRQVESQQTVWSVDVATIDYASWDPEIEIGEEALAEHFEANKFRYQEPEKVKARGIFFTSQTYIEEVDTPSESDLIQYFERNRPRYERQRDLAEAAQPVVPDPAAAVTPEAKLPLTFSDVRDDVVADWTKEQARSIAQQKALDFAETLYSDEIVKDSQKFDETVARLRGAIRWLNPYAENQTSEGSGLPAQQLSQLFHLPQGRYYSDPMQTIDGAAVAIFEEKVAPRIPDLSEVRAVAEANFREEERRRLFDEMGAETKARLEAAMAEGKPFAQAAEAEGLAVQAFDDFTSTNPPPDFNRSLFTQNQALEQGQISAMVFLDEGQSDSGKFVYLRKKEVPTIDGLSTDVEAARSQLSNFVNLFINAQGVVSEIVADERIRAQEEEVLQ